MNIKNVQTFRAEPFICVKRLFYTDEEFCPKRLYIFNVHWHFLEFFITFNVIIVWRIIFQFFSRLELSPVSPKSRVQDGDPSKSTINIYDLTKTIGDCDRSTHLGGRHLTNWRQFLMHLPCYWQWISSQHCLRIHEATLNDLLGGRHLTNWRQILCVCPVIDHKFRHNIVVKVAMDPGGDSRVDPQTTLTMLWRNSLSITGKMH